MSFDSIDKLFVQLLAQPQWDKQKRYLELKKYWYEIVNHKVAQHTRPVSIKHEVLYITTSNAMWSQELSLQKPNLLRKINRRVSKPIKDLHFASASWHNNLQSINAGVTAPTPENHPSFTTEQPDEKIEIAESETPQEAMEKWLQQIKNRSQTWTTCPNCGASCPEGEITRWGKCMVCFQQESLLVDYPVYEPEEEEEESGREGEGENFS